MPPLAARFVIGAHTVDLRERTVTCDGVALRLGWRHFEALKLLLEADRQVVSKERFFERLWPGNTVVDESNLTQCISHLRKALANGDPDTGYIETVPRMGYRLVAPAQSIESTAAAKPNESVESPRGDETASVPVLDKGPLRTRGHTRRPAAIAAAVLLVVSGTGLGWQWQQSIYSSADAAIADAARERGDQFLRSGDAAGAVKELQHAVRLNPSDARAYAALAHALHKQSTSDSLPRPPGQSPSVEAAERAVALDPRCGNCQGTLGFFLFYHDWQWARAEVHLQEAIRLEPSKEAIRPSYALLLVATGRAAHALEQIELALSKRPYEIGWHVIRASILYVAGKYPDAVAAADKALALNENDRTAWEWRSKALFQMGHGPDAIKALAQEAFSAHSSALDRAVAASGLQGGLRALLEITGDWRGRSEQSWRRIAWRALLGDDAGALEELERAYALRNVNLMYIGVDPVYDRIRSHPRFQRVLTDMGLTGGNLLAEASTREP